MRGQGMPRPYSAREPSVGAGHARPGPPRITRRGTFSTIVRIPSAEDYMKLFVFFLLAVALVLSAADVNVTGKWSGSVNVTQPDGTNEEGTTFAILKQDGGTVTGTAGPDEATQWTIEKGAIAGNKVTLQVDRKSTRLNSSHLGISYAVFCLKKTSTIHTMPRAFFITSIRNLQLSLCQCR